MTSDFTVENLISTARTYARQTLDGPGFRSTPYEDAFTALSGIVLERLAKAALMRRHPALVMDLTGKSSWETLLSLTGVAPGGTIRTASLKVALDRLRLAPLNVPLGVKAKEIDDLVELRNSSAHAIGSLTDPSLVGAYVKIVDSLLNDLDVARATFWMDCLQAADYAKAGAEARERERVRALIDKARSSYRREYPDDSPDAKEYHYEWSKNLTKSIPEWRLRDCPACENVGIMEGVLFKHRVSTPESDEEWTVIQFGPGSFRCSSCSLHLDDQVEVEYGISNIPNWTDISEEEFERIEPKREPSNVLGDV
ncbi:hypothetical protein [Streptomyces sp. NBC_00102]|uniref:hypothetical protein n=1 Tax=Streptomyces sp. NBC_00102 TaxID=2975652 RepID=UPI0022551529|nr:hypothetical protein [Streptomyces sp. NBC_00102]MCX5397060.1 hypothetical protein [Streptomyces sp. NBC_00102]